MINFQLWNNVQNPVGVVQIIPNRNHNIKNYDRVATFLNKNGYIVWADELYVGTSEKTVFDDTVRDEMETLMMLKQKFKLPVFVIGDGYGSFVAQKLMQYSSLCSGGVCLSGGGRYTTIMLKVGVAMSWIGKKIWGDDACPKVIGKKNTPTHKCRTYDFWFNLFKNLQTIQYDIMPNIPLLIIGGEQDIYSMNGRLAKSLYNTYSKHNLNKLTLIIYPDAEKDLLFLPEYSDVYQDILDFINNANFNK
ncbi:MAG: hypothetical protein IKW57_01150 [Alphaproteobacteria bacterium]|nr:hypothetical protein [Alphaproteobacteria bacterium]